RVAEARRQQALLAARQQAAESRTRAVRAFDPSVPPSLNDTAWETFERQRHKVEQAEAEADALAELVSPDVTLRPFSDAAAGTVPADPLDAQLAALKRSLQPAVA